MALQSSYLREIVNQAAKNKHIELSSTQSNTIWRLDKQLDNKEIEFQVAFNQIKKLFGSKFQKWEYRNIGNDIHRKLYNRPM